MAEKKKEGAAEEIQEVEYTPSSEVESSPTAQVPQVEYAQRETGEEKATRLTKEFATGASVLGVGAAKAGYGIGKGAVEFAMQSARGYIAKKKAEKEMRQAEQPQQHVRKFGRHTIRPGTEPYMPPQSPEMQHLERQFYTQESGGVQAMMQAKPVSFMDRFGSSNIMARFGGQSNIMAKFAGKQKKGMSRGALSPIQKMMFSQKGKKMANTYQKVMGGGSFFIGRKKKGR